jgi:hypothetical protein
MQPNMKDNHIDFNETGLLLLNKGRILRDAHAYLFLFCWPPPAMSGKTGQHRLRLTRPFRLCYKHVQSNKKNVDEDEYAPTRR